MATATKARRTKEPPPKISAPQAKCAQCGRPVAEGKRLCWVCQPDAHGQRLTEDLIPAGTSTTTPFGISRNDPDAVPDASPRAPGVSDDLPEIIGISIGELARNRFQPRKAFDEAAIDELCASLKLHGMLQPIVVRMAAVADRLEPMRLDAAGDCALFELIAGERRVLAAMKAGWVEVPGTIRQMSDAEAREAALIENLTREGLNDLEKGEAFLEVRKQQNLTQAELAAKIGKSEGYVANLERLLELPQAFKHRVLSCEMPSTHARYLLPYKDAPKVLAAVEKAIAGDGGVGTVKEFERRIRDAVVRNGVALHRHVYTKGPGGHKSADLRIPSDHPQYAELQVVEVSGWNGKEKRALNVALAKKILGEKEKTWRAKNDTSAKAGTDKGKKAPSEAERKVQAEHERDKFREALADWLNAWRCALCAERIEQCPAAQERLLFGIAAGICGTGDMAWELEQLLTKRWKATQLPRVGYVVREWFPQLWREDLTKIRGAALAELLTRQATPEARSDLDGPDLVALCEACEVSLVDAWTARPVPGKPQAFAGELTAAYLDLHSLEQLQEIALDDWHLPMPADLSKPKAIEYILHQPQRILKLPAELMELIGGTKRKATKVKPKPR